jgi:hypothetical protein
VLESIQQPGRLSAERVGTAGDLFHRPGTATNRALAHIYRILNLPPAAETADAVNAAREPAGVW